MRRLARTKAPVIDRIVLHDLSPAPATALEGEGMHEGLLLEGEDLSQRDLSGVVLSECALLGVTAHETDLRSSRLLETRIERMDASVLNLSRAVLRDVEIHGSRIGALDVYESSLSSVRFVGCKVDWINLRGAELENVLFEDCTIAEVDLGGARATRLAFEGCRTERLSVRQSRLQDVDLRGLQLVEVDDLQGLRGATIDGARAVELATSFAAHLGIRVED
ncbi:pentapeptide repeat-containing protein [Brachybacterium hainanense]|uniref:Pentapeptide repeat-containing protein n=1 Tax=Brachybacterium hainanense TaxID=1541174 RepID=A0ABV6RFH5_9MICO